MSASAPQLVKTGNRGEVQASSLKVTVIMPVYNAMPFLTEALDALLIQDIGLENFEFIAVDDGSTDSSLEELIKYADQFPYARIYTQPNSGGPSKPRNFAMDLVETPYFFLNDADDWIAPESLRKMVDIAERNSTDIVTVRMAGVGGRKVSTKMFRQTLELTDVWSSELYRLQNPMKLFRTSFIRENNLRFPDHMTVGGDRYFITHAYFATKRQSLLADQDYLFVRYRDDDQNLTSRVNTFGHKFLAVKSAVELLEELAPKGEKFDEMMMRHLRIEVGSAYFQPFADEEDEMLRREGFDWLTEVARRYEHLITSPELRPNGRAMLYLAHKGAYEEAVAYAREFNELVEDGYKAHFDEDGSCFFVGPRFRTGEDALPEYIYSTSPRYFFNPNVTEVRDNVLTLHVQTVLSEAWIDEHSDIRVFLIGDDLPKDGVNICHESKIFDKQARGPRSTNFSAEVVLDKQIENVPPGRYAVRIALGEFVTHLPFYGDIKPNKKGVVGEVHGSKGKYFLRYSPKGYLRIETPGYGSPLSIMKRLKARIKGQPK